MSATVVGTDSPVSKASATRVFWQFWTASTVSAWGSGVTAVALPVIALAVLNASAFELSLLTAGSYAAWLLIGLPAGALVQRYPLRTTQVSMDMARALAIASVPVCYALGVLTIAQLVGVALTISFADVIFSVGNSTFLPRIIPKADLIRRNSISSGTQSVTQFGAPALAGLLLAVVGPIASLLIDSVSYVLSSILLQRLPDPGRPARKVQRSMASDIGEGIAYVWHHAVMRPCVLAAAAVNCGLGALATLLPLFVVRGVGASPALVGPVLATDGVGSLVGAILVSRLVARFGSARTAVIGLSIAATGAVLFPLAHGPAALFIFSGGNLVCALGVVMFSIVTRTHRQMDTPPEILSRVQATVRFVSWGMVPLGSLAGGLLATWLAPVDALSFVAAMALVSLSVVVASPVRTRRGLEGVSEADPQHSAARRS